MLGPGKFMGDPVAVHHACNPAMPHAHACNLQLSMGPSLAVEVKANRFATGIKFTAVKLYIRRASCRVGVGCASNWKIAGQSTT